MFTTHSEYAIKPLPHEAVWAVLNGRAIQGKLEIDSLRSLMGEVNSEFFENKVFRLPGEAPESYAFLATWCEYFSEKVDDLISQFYDVLPSNDVGEAT